MKYFSSESVANAYMGFQGSVTNKSWGVLAIMHQLDSMIVQGELMLLIAVVCLHILNNYFVWEIKRIILTMEKNGLLSFLPSGVISLTSRGKLFLIFLT